MLVLYVIHSETVNYSLPFMENSYDVIPSVNWMIFLVNLHGRFIALNSSIPR